MTPARSAAIHPFLIAAWLLNAAAIEAQPVIGAVANSASGAITVAPGSIATIYGTGLATSTAINKVLPLPDSLGGASITIQGKAAPLYYASSGQLNFQVPADLAAGTSTAVVKAGGASSAPFSFIVLGSAPGIYLYGSSHAVAVNYQDGKLNGSGDPAAAKNFIIVYMTGQGPVDHAVPTGEPASGSPISQATAPASATVGGAPAKIAFLGFTPGLAGLLQANVEVPNMANGDYPLVITIGGVASNGATVSVSGTGPPAGTPQLTLLGSVKISQGVAINVAVSGTTAFVCGSQEIASVNVSNPASPAILAQFGQADLPSGGVMCQVLGNSLIEIVNTPALVVYDVTDPAAPEIEMSLTPPLPYAGAVFFAGNTGFFTTDWFRYLEGSNEIFEQHGELYAYDFSNFGFPAFVSSLGVDPKQPASSNLSPRFSGVAINHTALIASTTSTGGGTGDGDGRVEVIDISVPLTMKALRQVLIPEARIAGGIAVQGNTAIVAGNTASWRNPGVSNFDFTGMLTLTALDISDPANPAVTNTQVTTIQTSFGMPVPLQTGFFVIALPPAADSGSGSPSGNGELAVIDARNPKAMVLTVIASEPMLSGVAVAGDKVYTANATGMNIYQVK